jgi:hypothetical protein
MARGSNCNWHTEAVFRLTKPTAAAIEAKIAAASSLSSIMPLLSIGCVALRC